MRKAINFFLIIVVVIVGIILLDTIQARLFKRSSIISIRDSSLLDDDSYVDRGILINTYYCVKEKDIVKVVWHFKTSAFDCPIE